MVIESRIGKYAVVTALALLSVVMATSRPKKPTIVYPLAAVLAAGALWIGWRVEGAPPVEQSFPLGDPLEFIDAVPDHVGQLARWAQAQGLPSPPASASGMDEWLWSNRHALGEEWKSLMHGLVAAYGEALRSDTPSLTWLVRSGEPAIGRPRALWPARRIFREVHDAVHADV